MTKFILLLLPVLAFANGNHYKNSHHVIEKTVIERHEPVIVENTYIEYKAHNETFAAMAALSSIPSISHRKHDHRHSGIGFGAGSYNGEQGLGIAIQHQCDSISLKINSAVSGKEKIHGLGVTISF